MPQRNQRARKYKGFKMTERIRVYTISEGDLQNAIIRLRSLLRQASELVTHDKSDDFVAMRRDFGDPVWTIKATGPRNKAALFWYDSGLASKIEFEEADGTYITVERISASTYELVSTCRDYPDLVESYLVKYGAAQGMPWQDDGVISLNIEDGNGNLVDELYFRRFMGTEIIDSGFDVRLDQP